MAKKKRKKCLSFGMKILLYFLVAYGLFYAVLPHSLHQRIAPDWLLGFGFPHIAHVSIGLTLLIIAVVIYLMRMK